MAAFLKKLTSRKFLAAAAGLVTGLAMVFGLDEGIITTVSGAVVSVASVIAYIVAEGKVDAAAVKQAVAGVQEAAQAMNESDAPMRIGFEGGCDDENQSAGN